MIERVSQCLGSIGGHFTDDFVVGINATGGHDALIMREANELGVRPNALGERRQVIIHRHCMMRCEIRELLRVTLRRERLLDRTLQLFD
jgi:hypothetical protein